MENSQMPAHRRCCECAQDLKAGDAVTKKQDVGELNISRWDFDVGVTRDRQGCYHTFVHAFTRTYLNSSF